MQKHSRFAWVLAAWLSAAVTSDVVWAQAAGLVPAGAVDQAGLQVHWQSQLQIDRARGHLVEAVMVVSNARADTYFELLYSGRREVISEHDSDARGRLRGIEGAEQWAKLRREILTAGDVEVELNRVVVPHIRLFALTSDGVVQCLDGESGATLWTAAVGNPRKESIGLAASENRVAVVNGGMIYCLEADTGHFIWERPVRSIPGGGVAVSPHFAYVTAVDGRVHAFPLNETGIPDLNFVTHGRALVKPLVTAHSVSWPTDKNFYYLTHNDDVTSIRFRLRTHQPVLAPGAASGSTIYVVANDGEVYAFDEREARVLWTFSTGEPTSQSPMTVGEAVFVVTEFSNVFKLHGVNGQPFEQWPGAVPNIREFVGASRDRLYAIDRTGSLVGLSLENGAPLAIVPLGPVIVPFVNTKTDRLYLASRSGAIVCVREVSQVQPLVHRDVADLGWTGGEVGRTPID